jgi:thiol-disulfide isomerase/thioredoxin
MRAILRALDTSEPAPRFSAKTLTGETVNNQSLMDKVVLVQFWTTWCPYCRRDAELIDSLIDEFGKTGLVVLAVNVGESKKKYGLSSNRIRESEDRAHGRRLSPLCSPQKAFPNMHC